VVPADAPLKPARKIKLGETQQAILGLLKGADRNMTKKEIADALKDQDLTFRTVYNAIARLATLELLEVSGQIVHLNGGKS
jgi:Fe2+ or Zn2+ uptake regulation protein